MIIVGVKEMALDKEKELVTVKGTMDAKALAESLKERLKRPVEVVPPKKEKEGGGDGDKKDGGGGGKKKGGGDGGQEQGGGGNVMMENRMEVLGHPGFGYFDNGYGYGSGFVNGYGHANGSEYGYAHGYGGPMGVPMGGPMGVPVGAHLHQAPNMFSDENPNGCSIM